MNALQFGFGNLKNSSKRTFPYTLALRCMRLSRLGFSTLYTTYGGLSTRPSNPLHHCSAYH
jgi:hypothetical protein